MDARPSHYKRVNQGSYNSDHVEKKKASATHSASSAHYGGRCRVRDVGSCGSCNVPGIFRMQQNGFAIYLEDGRCAGVSSSAIYR